MDVFDLRVQFHYWEFIIKQNIYVQKIKVKKWVLNLPFLQLEFIKITSVAIYAERCALSFDISH